MSKDFTDPELVKRAQNLRETNYPKFMDLTFITITEDFDLTLESPEPLSKKIKAIDEVREYFESAEQYERCGILKNLYDYLVANTETNEDLSSTMQVVK